MRIEIHSFNGIHFDLDVEEAETLKNVKQKIRSKVNYPISQQSLIFNYNKIEDDDKTLSAYDIEDGASLELRIAGEWKITVELMNDLVISMEINPNYKIQDLKYIIQRKTQTRAEIQRLFLNGTELLDAAYICEAGIQDGTVLVCRPKMEILVNISGRKITVGTKGDDFIKEVKRQIRVMEELLSQKLRLMLNGTELDDMKRLCDYGIVDGSEIEMYKEPYTNADFVNIAVVDQDRTKYHFQVKMTTSIRNLQLVLQDKLKIPYAQFRLIFDGGRIDDFDTIHTLGIHDGDEIGMFLCQCGC
uniref:Ubiquitin-like domain-containing protein n=1 Tax=Panagrolaimus sp. PS1159 TaxID=55785 RepID=A0AC35GRP6_9BILA